MLTFPNCLWSTYIQYIKQVQREGHSQQRVGLSYLQLLCMFSTQLEIGFNNVCDDVNIETNKY